MFPLDFIRQNAETFCDIVCKTSSPFQICYFRTQPIELRNWCFALMFVRKFLGRLVDWPLGVCSSAACIDKERAYCEQCCGFLLLTCFGSLWLPPIVSYISLSCRVLCNPLRHEGKDGICFPRTEWPWRQSAIREYDFDKYTFRIKFVFESLFYWEMWKFGKCEMAITV